jgi:formylmethanofuran dehydrogenase subunit D
MADNASDFNAWNPTTWKNVHKFPHEFAKPEDFEKNHPLPEGHIYLDYVPGKMKTKFVVQKGAMAQDTSEIRTEDSAFEGYLTEKESKDKMVLKNKKGKVVAVCIQKGNVMATKVMIYSPLPHYEEQQPAKVTPSDGMPLFMWAEVQKDTSSPADKSAYKLKMETHGGVPVMKDIPLVGGTFPYLPLHPYFLVILFAHFVSSILFLCCPLSGMFGGAEKGAVYFTNEDFENFHYKTHARVIRQKQNTMGMVGNEAIAITQPYKSDVWKDGGYRVMVAPGIDPLIIVCFLAAQDSLKAKFHTDK